MVLKSRRQTLISLGVLVALLGLLILPALVQADNKPPEGYSYTIRQGDTWSNVSHRTGVSVAELKRLNPQAIHPKGWLWVGERLLVPGKPPTVEPPKVEPPKTESPKAVGYWYQVRPGDTWNTVARATGVPVRQLWAANPGLRNRQQWLYLGQRVWIPAAPPATPVTAAAARQPSWRRPRRQQVRRRLRLRLRRLPRQRRATAAAASKPRTVAGCPETFAGYPDAIAARLNLPGKTLKDLQAWLAACGALAEGDSGVTLAALQSPTSADVVVTIVDPAAASPEAKGALAVYHAQPQGGYTLARTDRWQGGDHPVGGRRHQCGREKRSGVDRHDLRRASPASRRWLWNRGMGTGTRPGLPAIRRWRARSTPSRMSCPTGSGEEILVHGGVIESPDAGPQRAWTETYASLNGAPYTLVGQKYDRSACLYHAIQDADALLGSWATGGFDPAIAAYQAALNDPTLTACWTVKDEVPLLKDFARFRLVVSYVAGGQSGKAADVAAQIEQPALKGAADAFLKSYKASGSVIQACRDTVDYARANPAAWQFLADWGLANPTFAPEDLCPLK